MQFSCEIYIFFLVRNKKKKKENNEKETGKFIMQILVYNFQITYAAQ